MGTLMSLSSISWVDGNHLVPEEFSVGPWAQLALGFLPVPGGKYVAWIRYWVRVSSL